MKTRSLLILLAIALVALPGCGKVRNLFHRKPAEPVAAATPVVAKPAPTATPEATPVSTSNRSANVVVLCYHRFEDLPRDYLAIKPSEFEAQMQGIKDNGFTVIPMKDFLAWRRGEKEIPAKSALITIDDGYVSAYNVAWPILKKFGYPFSMFDYIQYIGSGGKSITWDQLAEMRDAGVDIGCHSWSHQNLHGKALNKLAAEDLKKLGYEGWLKKEIVESKQLLEKNLAIKVETFTYPYGIYNQKARDFVKTAGYELAFTVYGQQHPRTPHLPVGHEHGWRRIVRLRRRGSDPGHGAVGRKLDGDGADGRRNGIRSQTALEGEPRHHGRGGTRQC